MFESQCEEKETGIVVNQVLQINDPIDHFCKCLLSIRLPNFSSLLQKYWPSFAFNLGYVSVNL